MYHKKSNNDQRRIYYLSRSKTVPNQKPLLLSKAIEGFLLNCKARQLSAHTVSDYEHTFKIFLAHVGDVSIASIEPAQIVAFLAAQKVGAKTALNYHVGLSALWTWAIRESYVERHVPRLVDKPKPKKTIIQPFSETEIRALFTGLRQMADRDKAALLLLLDTGLRASELCNMQFADIDMIGRKIKVLGKGNKERLLPFSARTASALFRHIQAIPEGQRPFSFERTSFGHHLARIGKRAGVQDVHPHRFRHTFAVTFLRNGGDPYTLQAILGHSTLDMVREYLAIAQIDIDTAHKRASPVENWKL